MSPPMEEPPEEEPKAMSAGPMIEEETTKEEEPGNKDQRLWNGTAPKEETPRRSCKEEQVW